MPLHSSIDTASSDFARNAESMRRWSPNSAISLTGRGPGGKPHGRDILARKMLARQRVDLLIDPGTAFSMSRWPPTALRRRREFGERHTGGRISGANVSWSPTTPIKGGT